MRLNLIDFNGLLVNAWAEAFRPFPEVTVQQGDLLAVAEHCVVSPANSYGIMDGGIDAEDRAFFGAQIDGQCRMRSPVGQRCTCQLAQVLLFIRDTSAFRT